MITPEQRARRTKGIFSSDIPRIMSGQGIQVAMEKMGLVERDDSLEDNIEIALGQDVETDVLDAYEHLDQVSIVRSPDTLLHPTESWCGAHPDGLRVEEALNVEAKTVGWYRREEYGEGGDEVPDSTLWQCQWQMFVTGTKMTRVPVLFVDSESLKILVMRLKRPDIFTVPLPIKIYTVLYDQEAVDMAYNAARRVWEAVTTGDLPEPETPDEVKLVYRKDNGTAVEATDEILLAHELLGHERAAAKLIEDAQERLKFQIQSYMRESATILRNPDGKVLATWKNNRDGEAFDKDALMRDHPDIYQKYLIPRKGARVFLYKPVKPDIKLLEKSLP